MDGKEYFYINPLHDFGNHRRNTWFNCACCPPNLSRTIAMMPGYLYSLSREGIWVHQYTGSYVSFTLENGDTIDILQVTSYPWDGHITIEITARESMLSSKQEFNVSDPFSIFLRIPGWIGKAKVEIKVNGELVANPIRSNAYLEISRNWKTGDIIDIQFPMEIKYIEAHPLLVENHGRVAITRGPLVYCMESADNPGVFISDICIDQSVDTDWEFLPEQLEGIVSVLLKAKIKRIDPAWNARLYRRFRGASPSIMSHDITVRAIPYYAWANRQPGEMQVWNIFQ